MLDLSWDGSNGFYSHVPFLRSRYGDTIHERIARLDLCITYLSGKTMEFPVESTPLQRGYRTAKASLTCGILLGAVNESDYFQAPRNDTYFTEKVDKSAAELRELGEGMYFNEASKNDPFWKTDFWNDYPRLLEIKQKYDPINFFTCHQCVGSDEITPRGETSGVGKLTSGLTIFILFITGTLMMF